MPSSEPDADSNQHATPPAEERADQDSARAATPRKGRAWPRTESWLLAAAFVATAVGKLIAVRRHQPSNLALAWADVAVSDVAFFAALATLLSLGRCLRTTRWMTRSQIILTSVTLVWSVGNAIWLIITGVQLQPGVIQVIAQHPAEFWPTVQPYFVMWPAVTVVASVAILAAGGWVVWKIIRPDVIARTRRTHVRHAAFMGACFSVAAILQVFVLPVAGMGFSGRVLNFNSHWYALASLAAVSTRSNGPEQKARTPPVAGERDAAPPDAAKGKPPNVVLVLLESISYESSGLGDPQRHTMPTLERLAAEGVEFVSTRVPASQTGKAFWATLAGTTPDVESDFVEAVLVDKPYEGLPSLLGRMGHRSAFFQMSKGGFQCTPCTFANFGFDWAWFRENLEDPSAHLGYLAGDDFRMLDPMFEWIAQDARPFFVMMITSAAHDPYEVPEWFGTPRADRESGYMQTVEYTDAFLARLCERLEEIGALDNTLLCVLGDHGESFRPESRRGRWIPYEDVIRVPWVVRWPGHVERGTRIDWPCSQLDVAPTLLSLLGYDISRAGFEGRNALLPSDPNRRLYFSSWFEGSPLGYLEGRHKWVYWPYNGKVFEYDLEADPAERAPATVTGVRKDRIVADLDLWQRSARIDFSAKRFRKRLLYDHWWAFSSGRYARSYYVP